MFVLLIAVSGVGLNYLLKYNFPNYYNQVGVSLMYQIIYYYSSIEMLYLKFYKYKFKQTIKIQDSNNIEFVKQVTTVNHTDILLFDRYQQMKKQIIQDVRENLYGRL